MTQEEKELVLKDLYGRLLHGVKFACNKNVYTAKGIDLIVTNEGNWEYAVTSKGIAPVEIDFIKPYLRPMSSMTEEEKKELEDICTMYNGDPNSSYEYFGVEIFHISRYGIDFETDYTAIDWLNAHHFDYRGLIGKGLALEAPTTMYIQ